MNIAAAGPVLKLFKDLLIRLAIISIGIGLMVVIGAMLFGFVWTVGEFIKDNVPNNPVMTHIGVANAVVPLEETFNIMVALLLLNIAGVITQIGFTAHRFVWSIIADSD
ncbi:MAG: hypothetical protein JXR25_03070 [Pontiellaceae bacterium]|nr:hypothetical protein [Pontiellaceae bacterium]